MALHDEVAELVARVGTTVLDDAGDFRAAFDDFVPEGLASEGEINLLADAIRLGALHRIIEQVEHGADPVTAVNLQAIRLAQQRGTQEVDGARWALAVLGFALGRVPASVVTPSAPGPSRVVASTPDPAPPTGLASTEAAPMPHTEAAPGRTRERRSGRRWRVLLGVVVVVILSAAGGALAIVLDREGRTSGPSEGPRSPTAAPSGLVVGTVVVTDEVAPAAAARRVVMASLASGVRLTAFGEVETLGDGAGARAPGPRDRIVAFTLDEGPCQEGPTCPWRPDQLSVMIGADRVPLPGPGPTYAAVAPDDATVFLNFTADGIEQRVNLADGSADEDNIAVLGRVRRTVEVGGSATIQPVPSIVGTVDPWAVTVGRAELFYFDDAGRGPGQPDQAFLRVEATYTNGGAPQRFHFGELSLKDARGRPMEARNAGTRARPVTVFVVPADFAQGTLIVGGDRVVPYDGSSYVLTIPEESFPLRF